MVYNYVYMAKQLDEQQREMVKNWLREGFTSKQVERLAAQAGFEAKASTVRHIYGPKVQKELERHAEIKSISNVWFNKEYRAERAAEIAEKLYGEIMDGKMFAEEVVEEETKFGNKVTTKPIYFAGLIKNWKDLVDTIGNELGQRKQTVDVNYNKNQNLNLSVLVDRIYSQDNAVDKQLEGAEIIDLPAGDDFSTDKDFLKVVEDQTPDEVKEVLDGGSDNEPEPEDSLF